MLVELSVVEQRYHAVMEVISGGVSRRRTLKRLDSKGSSQSVAQHLIDPGYR